MLFLFLHNVHIRFLYIAFEGHGNSFRLPRARFGASQTSIFCETDCKNQDFTDVGILMSSESFLVFVIGGLGSSFYDCLTLAPGLEIDAFPGRGPDPKLMGWAR